VEAFVVGFDAILIIDRDVRVNDDADREFVRAIM